MVYAKTIGDIMPMGIVSDEEFEKELTRSHEVKIPEVLPMPRPGRHEGDNNVPDSLRKIIGETAQIDGRQDALELAKTFGISPSSVSAYANGSTSTDSMNRQPNLNHINSAKERVSRKAMNRLVRSLNAITDEKLEETKPVELASIARAMSGIVKEMEPEKPKDPSENRDGPTFVFYSPQVRDERHYEIMMARE